MFTTNWRQIYFRIEILITFIIVWGPQLLITILSYLKISENKHYSPAENTTRTHGFPYEFQIAVIIVRLLLIK